MKHVLRTLALAAALTASLGLAACGSSSSSVVGTWGDPDAAGTPSLTFDADGRYAGTDGCNRVGGSWSAKGETIDLGDMFSTMMYCEGVDTWLTGAASARLADGSLDILDAEGNVLGTLAPGSTEAK